MRIKCIFIYNFPSSVIFKKLIQQKRKEKANNFMGKEKKKERDRVVEKINKK